MDCGMTAGRLPTARLCEVRILHRAVDGKLVKRSQQVLRLLSLPGWMHSSNEGFDGTRIRDVHATVAAQRWLHAFVPGDSARRVAQETKRQPKAARRFVAQGQELRENKTKLEESYIHRRSFDTETYQSMRAKLAEELTLAEMELRDAHAEEIEMETVLDYAEMVLTNASKPLESRAI